MTVTLRSHKTTGIQRVVREIARNAWEMGAAIPVAIHRGRVLSYYRHPAVPEIVELREGDVFVMLDASWNLTPEYLPVLEQLEAKRGSALVCLYDILPLIYPDAFPPALTALFADWLSRIVIRSDGVIADSRAAAESLRDYLGEQGGASKGFPIGWWRLGGDFRSDSNASVSGTAQRIASGKPYFLAVGTIEPRKGYPTALAAFEEIWAEGVDAAYVIVGGRGWGMKHFEKRLRAHPEFGRRLFWLDQANDADLQLLYGKALALVLASVAEGFGLPIVEAAMHGTPVIATDIPVFREVAGDSVSYFPLLDSAGLAARLREAVAEKRAAPDIAQVTWRESTTQLLGIVRDRAFQMQLD